MIIRPQQGSLLFITQPDHAAAAADLVAHFDGFADNPRRQQQIGFIGDNPAYQPLTLAP